ncbi:MAG TPA: hypothetical protein VLC98_11310 [Phnomibacter sp.]|nr:hypothetical protein [Phnomibacter sp.]
MLKLLKPLFFLVFLSCSFVSFSQTAAKVFSGVVLDAKTGKPLQSASITNVLKGITVMSHTEGRFTISINKGNILSFAAGGYYTDTLTATDSVMALSSLLLKLRPLPTTLPDAFVTANLNPYQRDSIARRKEFLSVVGEAKIPVVSRANNNGFGVGINIDRFTKREKKKRNARELFDVTEAEAYINYRWNDSLVYKYTKLEGDSLTEFMQANRPTWEWLRKNEGEEDMVYYINKSLKKYYKR